MEKDRSQAEAQHTGKTKAEGRIGTLRKPFSKPDPPLNIKAIFNAYYAQLCIVFALIHQLFLWEMLAAMTLEASCFLVTIHCTLFVKHCPFSLTALLILSPLP